MYTQYMTRYMCVHTVYDTVHVCTHGVSYGASVYMRLLYVSIISTKIRRIQRVRVCGEGVGWVKRVAVIDY